MVKYLLKFCLVFLVSMSAWAQTYTTTRVSVDDTASPLIGASINNVVLGFSVAKTAGGGSNLTNVVISTGSTNPNTVFSSVQLRKSTSNFASSTNTGATFTLNAGDITFAGAPIHGFGGGAETEFFYVVATVNPAVATTVATVPSITLGPFTEANTTYTGGSPTESAFTFSGSLYNFQALEATVTKQAFTASYIGGSTDKPIYGFKITTNGTSQDLSQVVFTLDIDPTDAAKFSTFKLVDNGASSTYTPAGATLVAAVLAGPAANTVTFNMGAAVAPISSSDKYFFLVANVSPAMASATVVSTLTSVAVNNPVGGGGVIGTGVGTNQSTTITALAATVTQQTFAASYVGGATDKPIYGFKITTNGTSQDLSQVVFTLDINPTDAAKFSTFKLVNNGASSTYTPAGATLVAPILTATTVTFNLGAAVAPISSSDKYFFLVANVSPAMASATVVSTLTSVAVNNPVGVGGVVGTGVGTTQSTTITSLAATVTQQAFAASYVSGATDKPIYGFKITTNGTSQDLSQVVFTLDISPTDAAKFSTFKLVNNGASSTYTPAGATLVAPILTATTVTFNLGAAVAPISSSDKYFFLVANVSPAMASATVVTTLTSLAVNNPVGGGGVIGTGVGTNQSTTITGAIMATAALAPGTSGVPAIPAGAILSAGTNLHILTGFSVASNATQTISAINFNYSTLSSIPLTEITDEYLYRNVNPTGLAGATLVDSDNTPDGNFTSLTESITAPTLYYYLVVDVDPSVTTSTNTLTVAPASVGVSVDVGTVNAFSLNRPFTFRSSQLSDIVLNGGTTNDIDYISKRSSTMADDGSNSVSIAQLQIRDGAGSDPDNKITRLTGLQISLTNSAMVKKIALYDGASELTGSEQTVSGATVTWDLTSTPLDAGDDGTKNFRVRITFQNTVTDNQRIHVTVTNASFAAGFSEFALTTAGGATTTGVAAPANQIEVGPLALSLAFLANPPSTPINTNFSLSLRARDAQNNVDLDYARPVTLTASGGGGILSVQAGEFLVPTLSAGAYNWTTLRLTQSGNYSLLASDNPHDDDFTDATGTVTITSSSSTITPSVDPILCYGSTTGGTTAFENLGNIIIAETDNAGISGSAGTYTFSIALPSGFVFDPAVTSGLSFSVGSDLSAPSAYTYPGSNIVEFSFTLNGTSNINTITIGGLRAGYTHPGTVSPGPTGSLTITRSGGSATIAGVGAGVVLGSISALQSNPAVTFGVSAISGVAIPANTVTFNSGSAAVNLVGTGTPVGVFSGSGVTPPPPNYRFNPSALSPGVYPITYLQTSANGCQSVAITNFEVYLAGISTLATSYCSNDPASPAFTVSQTFLDQRFGGTGVWFVDHYVYYDVSIGNFVPITSPTTYPNPITFDPSRPEYQNTINAFGGQIPIGFAVCDGGATPCNGLSNVGTFSAYQWVTVKPAPSVSFSIPSTIFCEDNTAVTLTGLPANSTNIVNDNFVATGNGVAAISHALVGPDEVWTFSPAAVTGVTAVAPQTFNITYKFKDPITSCSNTSVQSITVKDRPASLINTDITNPLNSTSITLCQNTPVGSFTAAAGPSYKWYSNVGLTTQVGTGNTFFPAVNNTIPATTNFWVTRTTGATAIPFFAGCESDKGSIVSPLQLSVNVIASPAAPSLTFTDLTRQYCIGATVNPTHLGVTGTSIKWYTGLGVPIAPVPVNPNLPTTSELSIVTTAAATFDYRVTQTEAVNNCEGPPANLSVRVKTLPNLTLTADIDQNKICTTGPLVRFTAQDQGNLAPNGIWSGAGLVPSLNPFPSLGETDLNPAALAPNGYTLSYLYTDAATLCTSSGSINLVVLPTITPSISIGNVCNGSSAIIVNNSTVNNSTTPVSAATINFAEWSLGDGSSIPVNALAADINTTINLNSGNTTGTYLNPQHIYPNIGTFQLSGALTTSDGCRYLIPNTPVTVSPLPKIDFFWRQACRDAVSTTEFTAVENTTPTTIPIVTYTWNFNVNNTLSFSSAGAGVNPIVNYTIDGKDEVELIATTAANCQDIIKKTVYVVPSFPAITPTNSYNQSFDAGADGWIAGGQNSSWALGTPAKTVIQGAASGANAWVTNLTGNNNPNESSWVLSRCFDFTQAAKPVISLDIWSNTPRGVDGAVLQYNENGNIENDNNWIVIGTVGSGVNWYDDQGISNSPGNQASGDLGWTGDAGSSGGKYSTWQKAIFKLDNLIGKPKVVFRLAFSSSQASKDGFAFDNVFIGERSRVVLLENFTNSSGFAAHNDFYRNFGNAAELVKIQYHTPFPGDDALNALNTQMNNSRAAFYGITSAPTARVDGDFESGNITNWLSPFYDDRVLTPSFIKLDVTAVKTGSTVKISTSITNNSGQSVPLAGTHIFTTVVEKSIVDAALLGNSGNNEFVYVAKQMLPTSTGLIIPNNLGAGQTYTAPDVIWENNTGDAIAVFVQSVEGNNKNIFQSTFLPNPPQPDVVTGLGDLLLVDKISIYPNPADEEMTIQLPAPAPQRIQLQMVDQVGRVVNEHFIAEGERSKTISTRDLAGGIYLLQLGSGDTSTRKKILVVHGK